MQLRTLLLAAVAGSAFPAVAWSQPVDAGPTTEVEEVIVTALPLGRTESQVASSVTVLDGQALDDRRQSTLGETLNGIPGVNSDTFGGGASRPVIRGQTAPRVKVLSDGASLHDASEVSPDHAITTEPLLLERIEILRGPNALLYGGGAIGGAVNLVDRKVPTALPVDGVDGRAEVRVGTGDGEFGGAGSLDIALGQSVVLHVEGAGRRTDDYEVPDWEEDVLHGSFNRSGSAAIGLSWIGSRGYIGAAYSTVASEYGLPGHSHEYEDCHPHGSTIHCGGHGHDDHDHDHDDEHEAVPIVELESRRFDVRAELFDPAPGIERVRFRGGYTDYAHDEIEGGEVATRFTNEGYDGRIEVQHAPIGGFRGIVGAQASRSDFAALGDEAFIPESETSSTAVFVLEELNLDDWRFEGAVRGEWTDLSAALRPDRDFDAFSASAAAIWSFTPGYSVSVAVARSQRAPSAQELYARGVHLATNTYEIGDPDLDVETVASAELTFRKTDGATRFSASAFRYAYDGYIYARTLDQFEDFRLIRYTQADATFTGLEAEVSHDVTPDLTLSAFGDLVRGELDGAGGDLPRIPAARLGGRADYVRDQWYASVEYYHAFDQEDVAAYETRTPGFDMLNATVSYDLPVAGLEAQLFARGTNLLDDLALNHASFLTNVAPLRGRNIVFGLRMAF